MKSETKKYGVLVHKGGNIGDYIQAVAASQFCGDEMPELIERERLRSYRGGIEVIMNAWFMREPDNWPPSDDIKPFFLAFHINSTVRQEMLSEESVAYLKHYEPIGCRDLNTLEMLEEKGVKCFFSGCLTLTLGCRYAVDRTKAAYNGKIYIANLSFRSNRMANLPRNITVLTRQLLTHPRLLLRLRKKIKAYPDTLFRQLIDTANIIDTYLPVVDKDILLEAEYVSHITDFTTYDDMFSLAERMVRNYAAARFVITNKIHCALPCLGLGTPVVWIDDVGGNEEYRCRLKGISCLFNKIMYKDGRTSLNIEGFTAKKLTKDNFPANPVRHLPLQHRLLGALKVAGFCVPADN